MNIWIISGARDATEADHYATIRKTLSDLAREQGELPDLVVHGGACGVDALASRWAYEEKINLDIIGAQWGTYGPAAGPKRNMEMLNRHGSPRCTVICFPGDRSKGTKHMIREALRRGYHTRIVPI